VGKENFPHPKTNTLVRGSVELRPVKDYKSSRGERVMDERELDIQKLRRSIEDAKQLQAELRQRAAELSKLLKKAQALKPARDKDQKKSGSSN
jgi:hypothetical protein